MIFLSDYAKYYNILYQDKDYKEEFEFMLKIFSKHNTQVHSLLDLGCGNGKHLFAAAEKGIDTVGVDISQHMLDLAFKHCQHVQVENTSIAVPQFHLEDIRFLQLERNFSCVTSLFHVMSYQITEKDLLAVLKTAWKHLHPGGIFLFDFWHGPGVLSELPSQREKIFENAHSKVHRTAIPYLRLEDNVVEVNFTIDFLDKTTLNRNVFHETHKMRYWFLPELRFLAEISGFKYITAGAWLETELPSCAHWYAYIVLKKQV